MNLGTFTKNEAGSIIGSASTLLSTFELEYRPIEKKGNGPDFRLYKPGTEIEVGFATHKFGSKSGKRYLNTLIDTPEFPNAIWAALVMEEDGSYVLKWSGPRRKSTGSASSAANNDTGESTAANF